MRGRRVISIAAKTLTKRIVVVEARDLQSPFLDEEAEDDQDHPGGQDAEADPGECRHPRSLLPLLGGRDTQNDGI